MLGFQIHNICNDCCSTRHSLFKPDEGTSDLMLDSCQIVLQPSCSKFLSRESLSSSSRCLSFPKGLFRNGSRGPIFTKQPSQPRCVRVKSSSSVATEEQRDDVNAADQMESIQENRMITRKEALVQKLLGLLIISLCCKMAHFLTTIEVFLFTLDRQRTSSRIVSCKFELHPRSSTYCFHVESTTCTNMHLTFCSGCAT